MKSVTLIIMLLFSSMVFAQNVPPPDTNAGTLNSIQNEHKATRKYVSDELTRQRNEFFNAFEEQALYYENKANRMIALAVTRLTLLWGGVVLVIFGMANFLNRKLEKRKWNKMLDTAKEEIKREIIEQTTTQHTKKTEELDKRQEQINSKIKEYNEAKPQLMAIKNKMQKQEKELKSIFNNLELTGDSKSG